MTIAETDAEKVRADRFGEKETETAPNSPGAVPSSDPPKRKRGRPPGSKTKNKTETPTVPAKPERTPEEQKQGAALCAFLAATIWDIGAPFAKRRSLTDDEALKLGQALDPVLWKYAPAISNWQLEINLLVTVAMLWQGTAIDSSQGKADLEVGEQAA